MARPISKNPRRQFVGVKFTDDQYSLLIQAAHIMGMPVSTMIRSMSVNQSVQILEKLNLKKSF